MLGILLASPYALHGQSKQNHSTCLDHPISQCYTLADAAALLHASITTLENLPTPQAKAEQLIAIVEELAHDVSLPPSHGEVGAMTQGTRIRLIDALEKMQLALQGPEQADEKIEETKVLKMIGTLSTHYGNLFWNEENSTYVARTQPATMKKIEGHLSRLLEDLTQNRPLSNYAGPHRRLKKPPSNEDLTLLEDYFEICSEGVLQFDHNCPGLDTDITPETKAVLQARQSQSG